MKNTPSPASEPFPVPGAQSPQSDLKAIAKLAGVSITTVHDALKGKGRVNPATRERVRSIAAQIGYRPNRLARALRTKRSNIIGVLMGSLFSALYEPLVRQVEAIARKAGFNALYACSYSDAASERELLDVLLGTGVDGLLFFPGGIHENRKHYASAFAHTPVVMIDSPAPTPEFDTVAFDNRAAGQLAVKRLVQAGRRNLGFVVSPVYVFQDWWITERMHGAAQAVAELGLPPLKIFATERAEDAVMARYSPASLRQFMLTGGTIDGLFAANDSTAYAAMEELKLSNKRAPIDVSVIGCDDLMSSSHCVPALTTLRQPMAQMGEAAIKLLLKKLAAGPLDEADGSDKPQQIMIAPRLMERESVV